ncbi:MAG: CRISPR-associated protein Cas4 [Rhodobacteraceae bacterium]|nr:CRISPR-associated protein Cas4 [Paracoccaceae bacterium]
MSSHSDGSLPISALQHWLYCPRQCALIHVERLWVENRLTAEGRALHNRVDTGGHESRKGVKTLRSVELASEQYCLHGVADVVQLRGMPPEPYPVEYKRGRAKDHRADDVQLCAQAICLEEMFSVRIPEGAIYYGKSRRQKRVAFDLSLRTLTLGIIEQASAAINEARVPTPQYEERKCGACSLISLCKPKRMESPPRVAAWLARAAASKAVPE